MDINTILNNPNNMYYGHGTGTSDKEAIDSIMKNGVRNSHGAFKYTRVPLGIGTKIQDSAYQMMRKWPHKESDIVVVISLPLKYIIIESPDLGTRNMAEAAFNYIPDEASREAEELTDSPYVIPEFVVGYYDARTDSFFHNPKYYEKLPQSEQDKLFDRVKQNYFDTIEGGCGIEYYQQALTYIEKEFPLTTAEVDTLKRKKKEKELLARLNPELLKKEVALPNGEQISAIKYISEIVLPFIPTEGYIVLTNGNKLPVLQFITECVLFDCQAQYSGDFSRYIAENVDTEKTKQINSSISNTDGVAKT